MPFVHRAHLPSGQNPPVDPSFRARPAPGQRMPQKHPVLQHLPVHGPHALASETAAAPAKFEQRQAETNQPQAGHKWLAGCRNTYREGGLYRGRLYASALLFFFSFFPTVSANRTNAFFMQRSLLACVCQGEDELALRQCYEGVERDGEVIRVRDTVLLRSGPRKKSLPYVAKISALWEDPKTGTTLRGGQGPGRNPWQAIRRGPDRLPVCLCVCVCCYLPPQES